MNTVNLSELKPGDSARIIGYLDEDVAYRQQLLALGLTPGARVDVVRTAPFGDPKQIRVRGASLFLRRADATTLCVEKL